MTEGSTVLVCESCQLNDVLCGCAKKLEIPCRWMTDKGFVQKTLSCSPRTDYYQGGLPAKTDTSLIQRIQWKHVIDFAYICIFLQEINCFSSDKLSPTSRFEVFLHTGCCHPSPALAICDVPSVRCRAFTREMHFLKFRMSVPDNCSESSEWIKPPKMMEAVGVCCCIITDWYRLHTLERSRFQDQKKITNAHNSTTWVSLIQRGSRDGFYRGWTGHDVNINYV